MKRFVKKSCQFSSNANLVEFEAALTLVPESGLQGWQRPCGHFGVCDVGVRCGHQTV